MRPDDHTARGLSLAAKLTGIGAGTAAVSLVLMAAAFFAWDFATSRERLVRDIDGVAEVIGWNSSAALAFADSDAAAEVLRRVAISEQIVAAEIVSVDGTVIAGHRTAGTPLDRDVSADAAIRAGVPWHAFTRTGLLLVRPVRLGDELLGAVYVETDQRELRQRTWALARIVGGVFCAAVLLSLVLASRLQRAISGPLLRLTEITRLVTHEQRYDLRAPIGGSAEIGELVSGFNTMLDEIQQRDQRLLRTREHLEATVETRTAELRALNTDLLAARDRAMDASRAKGEFLANMSHELRTPLNGIIGMTELALGHGLEADTRDCLDTVKLSAESLLAILNDVLDFSRIESRKLEFECVPFVLPDVLGEMLKPIAIRADQKGLELILRIEAGVPAGIAGDPGRLQQILTNLVGNAIKFTERGHIILDVREETRTNECTMLHFSVSDTGVGIPRDKHASIFEAFTQADGSTTRRFGGSGLGLTIAASLVQMMGGRIWVTSEPGLGSAFHFTVPFDIAAVAEPALPARLAGMEVLVVDDNPVNRRVLVDQLARWDMRPTAVDCGRAAIDTLLDAARSNTPFLLVLLDANMPDMDGFDVAERIAAHPALAGTTIMMLTSSGRYGDAARCRELGISAYLTKPVNERDLLIQVTRALRSGPERAAPASMPARRSGKAALAVCAEPRRILLAEDNPVNQRVAAGLLTQRGHHVSIANNGREAVDLLEREAFDLVLMDVQMPVMGGLEATAAIRERERARGGYTRIVAMTAHAMSGDRERCMASGMDGYLPKPVNQALLYEVVEGGAAGVVSRAAPLNSTELLERLGGDANLLAEIIRIALEDCPKRLAAIAEAVERRDGELIRTTAHALKGAAGTLTAELLFQAAGVLERIGAENRLDAAEAARRVVAGEAVALMDALRRQLSALEEGVTCAH